MTQDSVMVHKAAVSRKFDLDHSDIAPGRKLRTHFARYWSDSFDDMRAKYDEFTAATPVAANVSFRKTSGDPAPGWWCEPSEAASDRAIFFIHGGGYGLGSAKAYRNFASQIATLTKTNVFAFEYPLAPEAILPKAVDQATDAITRLSSHYRVAVVGDSAGGGLSLAASAKLANRSQTLAAVVTFSPWVDLTLSGETIRRMTIGDVLLNPEYLRQSALQYAGNKPLDDAQGSPLFEPPANMPPILIQVGTDETLLDDSTRYAEAAARVGNNIELEICEGMHHVFQLNVAELATARHALKRASEFLLRHFD